MRTSIEISDAILKEVEKIKKSENRTMRSIVEEALRSAISRRRQKNPEFRLKRKSFNGKGLHRDFSQDRWGDIRDASYEGRGA